MRYINLILIFILLIGCSSAPPVPTDRFYRLSLSNSGNSERITEDIIYIGPIIAEGLYNERALLYTSENGSDELQQYHYHFWVTSPPHLIQDNLVKYLRSGNAAPLLVTEPASGESIKIFGKLHALERIISGENSTANLSIEITVTRKGVEVPLLIKEYQVTESVNKNKIPAVIEAYNRALDKIFSELRTDLSSVLN